MINKKGQVQGLITGLVFGIASLVIAVIIAFVIVSTLTSSDLLTSGRGSITHLNESGHINGTGYTLIHYSDRNTIQSTVSIIVISNGTDDITSGNYSLTSGLIINLTSENFNDVNISYSYSTYSNEEVSEKSLVSNFTAGVDNVSEKIPTVLLVAAIVLILGVLVLLVGTWQRMNLGGGGI